MASQLSIYNDALGSLQSRSLAGLTESREPKRVLDSYWPDSVAYCLAQGQWLFAKRTAMLTADPTPPQFGYTAKFAHPGDWVRTVWLSTQPLMDPPLRDYEEQAGFVFANTTPLYMAYVSNDPLYGMNIGAWPQNFTEFVAARLARKACLRLTGDQALAAALVKEETKAERDAKGNDAMNAAPANPPMGTWARSRRGGLRGGMIGFGGSIATGPAGDD